MRIVNCVLRRPAQHNRVCHCADFLGLRVAAIWRNQLFRCDYAVPRATLLSVRHRNAQVRPSFGDASIMAFFLSVHKRKYDIATRICPSPETRNCTEGQSTSISCCYARSAMTTAARGGKEEQPSACFCLSRHFYPHSWQAKIAETRDNPNVA